MFVNHSLVKPDDLISLEYANMLIEANIPYCLHLPTNIEIEVVLPERDIKGKILFRKVWTNRAKEDQLPSDDVDFYMSGAPTYFNKSTMLPPWLPLRPAEGWDQYFTGRNIERMKDQNGTFRYTTIMIEFDPKLSDEQIEKLKHLTKGEGEAIFDKISEDALALVNRVIDCYRYVTKEDYIERVGVLSINNAYFKKENFGFYRVGLVPGVESAMMNRSKEEIERIEELLNSAVQVPLYELLILDSHSAFDKKSLTLSVVESFQALEIMLENYLTSALIKKGLSQIDCDEKLNTYWRTKDRLNILMNEAKGKALNTTELWERWHTKYDKVRNEVIHQGKQISVNDAKETIEINESVIGWIKNLP